MLVSRGIKGGRIPTFSRSRLKSRSGYQMYCLPTPLRCDNFRSIERVKSVHNLAEKGDRVGSV